MQSKKRDGLLSALFSILTCGLYSIYFWYRYGEDVNEICADDGESTPNYIVAWLLSIITCGIYGVYWIYNLASRLDTASKKYDVNVESPVFFTLFMQVPFLSYFYACDVMNKFQDKYNSMYPNRNSGFGGSGYRPDNGNVPPFTPYSGGSGNGQSMGAQIGSQLKAVVQDVSSGIKNSAQNAASAKAPEAGMGTTCKNCGAIVPPGKNYCKNCGYPVNGPQNSEPRQTGEAISQEKTAPKQQEIPKPAETPQQPETTKQPICPKCGSTVRQGDKFCIHCGSKIN